MVVACIALAVAMAGTGYAATALPRNSVGGVQLKKNAVTSTKVKNGSLLRADFKPGQLIPGARGPAGPVGPAGPAGPGARWALVRADEGVYILDFGASLTGKLLLVSSANTADTTDRGTVSAGICGGTTEGGTCPTGNDTNHVRVITRRKGDDLAQDHPFYVAVVG
jgi:hypothetical protein